MSLPQVSSLDTARSASQSVDDNIAGNSTASGGMQLRNEFLQMMVAQLQNQDPTNPLDGSQYVTQLAQFSMVEGVEQLKVLQQKSIAMMDTQQVLQSTDLIGRDVMVPTVALKQGEEKAIRGQIELGGAADQVELKVFDEHGTLVATRNWGESKAGAIDYDLPVLPAGAYSFEVKASLAGNSVQSKHYAASTVDRVTLPGTGEIMLEVAGVGEVPLFSAIQFGKST
jgi:flagellar basal-body rod modification protein FlgD